MKISKFILSLLVAMLFSTVVGGTVAAGFDINPFITSGSLLALSCIPLGISGSFFETIVPPVTTGTDLNAKAQEIEALIKKGVEEAKAAGETSRETMNALKSHVDSYNTAFAKLTDQIKKQQEQIDKMELDSKRGSGITVVKSFGSEFKRMIEGDHKEAFEKFQKRESSRLRLKMDGISIDHFKIAGTITTPANLVPPVYIDGIHRSPERPRYMRDILRVLPTTADTIKYVYESATTDGSAMQASQGSAKGQSDFTLAVGSEPVETLATFMIISNQMLADVPGLMAYIQSRFTGKLKKVEDTEILTGSGTTPHLNGLITAATAYNNTGAQVTSINEYDVLRKAIAQAKVGEYSPTYIVLNPVDMLNMKLLKDSTYRSLFMDIPNIDGVPFFETNAITSGTFLVGDFSMGCTLWDRQGVVIEFSDSDTDNFQKNLVTIRIEERLALTVENGAAFITDTFAHAKAVGSAT